LHLGRNRGYGMFGRRKQPQVDITYVGSVLMTMSQAVFAASEYGTKPEGSWRQLTNLLFGVMNRRGWFPDSEDFNMQAIVELVQAQTANPYGDMPLGNTWEFYGSAPLPEDRLNIVKEALMDLGDLPQSVAIPTFMDELAPVMGKEGRQLLSFAQALPLVHAGFTMVTVFGDTTNVGSNERQARRELAAGLEAEFICGWSMAEMVTVASGRDMGDQYANAYQPWW